jgi:hypothetical protein
LTVKLTIGSDRGLCETASCTKDSRKSVKIVKAQELAFERAARTGLLAREETALSFAS